MMDTTTALALVELGADVRDDILRQLGVVPR
jgi:hypothetical protein